MQNNFKKNLLTFFLAVALVLPFIVQAGNPVLDNLDKATQKTFIAIDGGEGPSLVGIIGIIIRVTLSILGVIFISLMIWSGFNWMTAAGEEAKVSKAKDTIRRAIIGIIIVVASFSFWEYIQTVLFGSN